MWLKSCHEICFVSGGLPYSYLEIVVKMFKHRSNNSVVAAVSLNYFLKIQRLFNKCFRHMFCLKQWCGYDTSGEIILNVTASCSVYAARPYYIDIQIQSVNMDFLCFVSHPKAQWEVHNHLVLEIFFKLMCKFIVKMSMSNLLRIYMYLYRSFTQSCANDVRGDDCLIVPPHTTNQSNNLLLWNWAYFFCSAYKSRLVVAGSTGQAFWSMSQTCSMGFIATVLLKMNTILIKVTSMTTSIRKWYV